MRRTLGWMLTLAVLCPGVAAIAKPKDKEEPKKKDVLSAETFTGLELRGLGPATTSGRVADIAVDRSAPGTYYVAVASGGVWKTTNQGTTWTPLFDDQGSYSIGCISIDPNHPLVLWVGTGENNSQRSVSYGDGVYKSLDGGVSWENVGLKASEHIGKILIDPRDSDTVYVAAQGPLWNAGGDRGLYKSEDGGKTWAAVLTISENTGVSDIWFDPRDPDVIYAAAYQRRRHVWTLIDGGPESGIHKSEDGGKTWRRLEKGLPKGEMGRIGLAVSPADPDVVYALIEAAEEKEQGFYRSRNQGGSWERMSDYASTSPQYYQELIPDPKDVDRVYSMDTWMHVTEDGGKSFHKVGERFKHVDNHALWIDPQHTDHLLAGCDGGVYESYDRGATWGFVDNLPVAQFYRVSADNAAPFYNVYGGTQDNASLGGPSRTRTDHGILNSDWFVTVGGDGYETQIDPEDPDVVYALWQYGGLVRYDKRTGEVLDIKPQSAPGEAPLRFNWDSPLIISPHSHTRLYFAAQRLFRSDDRGESWRAVSPDLSAQIDRNKLPVMGKVWSVDAVSKNASTSFYGNIVSLCESPLQEGLIYVGTDDGLVQVTEDGGITWRKVESLPGVPARTYVSDLEASRHEKDTVYASFDNHKMGDYKPYVLKSRDRGRTWSSVAGDLPERGSVYTLAEDHVVPQLLFAGTEFGAFFTVDGGQRWIQLKGGLPIIAVRDIDLQRRENDLVLATFGRGFYVLDDYSPLRQITRESLEQDALCFAPRKAWMYIPSTPLGLPKKGEKGDGLYAADNPPFGAVFTYYLKDEIQTLRKQREEQEKKVGEGTLSYPSWDELQAEDRELEPAVVMTVNDSEGNVVRRLTGPVEAGFHRVAWDLRYPPADPTDLEPKKDDNPFDTGPIGPLALPGSYAVAFAKRVNGEVEPFGEPQPFVAELLGTASLPAPDRERLLAFEKKTARLQRAVLGAIESAHEADRRIDHLRQALQDTPGAEPTLSQELLALRDRLADLEVSLTGDTTRAQRNEPVPPSIRERVQSIVYGQWTTTSAPTETHRQAYAAAAAQFEATLEGLRTLIGTDLVSLEAAAEAAGAPWTPGRLPDWKPE